MALQAVLLELFLILTLIIVGVEALVLLKIQHERKNIVYFAPVLGLSAVVLITFFFNRIGIPVNHISKILFPLIYILLFIKFSSIKRMISRQFINVVFITVLGLQLTFWPLLKFGFKWISYANDDMTNYVLAAQRLYSNGFFDKIDFSKFLGGKEYSEEFYFMHVTSGVRPGSELLLAFNSFLTSGDSLKVFMVTIASLQFVLIISVVALVMTTQKVSLKKLYFLSLLLAIFPLISLGSLYQLIGQVGGVALSIGIYGLAITAIKENEVIQKKIVIGFAISLASLTIWYPEILPFGLLPILIVVIHGWRQRLIRTAQVVKFSLFTGLFLVLVLNKYLLDALQFLIKQTSNASSSQGSYEAHTLIFPYYLIPNGLPSAFGLAPFHRIANEPIASTLIIIAALLLLSIIYSLPKLVKINWYATIPFLMYSCVALILFFQKSDFGLFKVAMFFAPWLALALFNVYLSHFGSKLKAYKLSMAIVSAVPVIGLMIITQFTYSSTSVYNRGGLQEIANSTTSNLVGQMDTTLSSYKPEMGNLLIDTTNQPTAKLFMSRGQGIPIVFPAMNYMLSVDTWSLGKFPQLSSRSDAHTIDTQLGVNSFEIPRQQLNPSKIKDSYVLSLNGGDSMFNRLPRSTNGIYSILKNPNNFLIFKDSELGPHYYRSDKARVAFWRLEKDPMMPGSEISALGQVIFMQVLNPMPKSHVILEISSTVLEQNARVLPRAGISGVENASFDIVGRGSARVLSTVVSPYDVSGINFLQLNFFDKGRYFENKKRGLNSLYNKEVSLDPRKIVTFGRAINLTNRSEALFDAPVSVSSFPKDLEDEELLYSGIYESGWLSEDSYFYLKSNANNSLKLSGFVPLIKNKDFATNVEITIDGKQVAKRNLQVGDFEFNLDALGIKPGVHRVGIHFDKYQNIQGKQQLFAAGFLRQLGFFPTS